MEMKEVIVVTVLQKSHQYEIQKNKIKINLNNIGGLELDYPKSQFNDLNPKTLYLKTR